MYTEEKTRGSQACSRRGRWWVGAAPQSKAVAVTAERRSERRAQREGVQPGARVQQGWLFTSVEKDGQLSRHPETGGLYRQKIKSMPPLFTSMK